MSWKHNNPLQHREISRKGMRAIQEEGKQHKLTSETARIAAKARWAKHFAAMKAKKDAVEQEEIEQAKQEDSSHAE